MSDLNQPCVDAAALCEIEKEVVERFLRYVRIDTQSDEESGLHPSTGKQFDLARVLVSELEDLGVDYFFDEEKCYLYAWLAPSDPLTSLSSDPAASPSSDSSPKALADASLGAPAIGFIAHLDTSPEASGANVDPQIIENYDGGEITLGGSSASSGDAASASPEAPDSDAAGSESSGALTSSSILSPKDFPELLKYKGQTLITSDGSTLLGADDKAGVAEIMTMVHYLISHPEIPHGKICVAFTPDEEIGEGTFGFDIDRFDAEYAYTIDGGELGELSYENFNAASATIKITGRNVHPGEAFGKMVHAARLAMEIEANLPPEERPEKTKDHQGFYHLTDISGDASQATMKYILRDHDQVLFEKKKETVREVCAKVEAAHPGAKIDVEIRDSYFNMLEKIKPHFHVVERCREAMLRCGIEPRIEPIRGGTDGAMLSYRGLPCPNICAGGHNFHGVYEYISCEAMAKITGLLVEIAKA